MKNGTTSILPVRFKKINNADVESIVFLFK